tara:strand:+ start:24485 stop:24709 length:225 start_codon:yes stop_codon:yes gene_type:complete
VRANIRDRAQFAAVIGHDAPVEIGRMKQPILGIAAGDVKQITDGAAANSASRFDAQRVIADVVIDCCRDTGGRG